MNDHESAEGPERVRETWEWIVRALSDADGPLVGPGSAPGLAGGALVWLDPRDVYVEGWGPLRP
ncbi:hypothetical protein OG357_36055 [Streptomyces sp. NBC_01255]|uniref:hypothetical protein n=1 Tax=Streptomyces sp. NBC_01255 TaxID=2903798 RepID=UPI002E333EC9|nr:hypothetical protein [Streptomyces sp. NBC_01255]